MTKPTKKLLLLVFPILIILGFAIGMPVYAQSKPESGSKEGAQAQKTSTGTTADEQTIPSADALGSIFFKSRNSLIFSFGAAESITNNLYYTPLSSLQFGTPQAYTGNYFPITSLAGRVAYQRQLSTTTFGVDYGVGYGILTQGTTNNFLSQNGGIFITHRVTPRFNFNLASSVFVSPLSGRFYTPESILPAFSQNIVPNSSLIIGYGRSIGNTTNGGFSYDLSRRASFNANFYYTLTRYLQAGSYSMNQPGVNASYSYQLKERTSIQLGYLFSYYSFDNRKALSGNTLPEGSSIYRNHFAYLGFTHQFTPGISGSIQVGPNFIIGNPIYYVGGSYGQRPGTRLGVNGTITFTQAISLDPRTFFSINMGQYVTDGSGLGYVSANLNGGGSLGHLFTRKLLGSITGNYSHNKFLMNLDTNGQPLTANSVTCGALLRMNATQRFQIFGNYMYFNQLSQGFSGYIPASGNGSTFTVGISYALPVFY